MAGLNATTPHSTNLTEELMAAIATASVSANTDDHRAQVSNCPPDWPL